MDGLCAFARSLQTGVTEFRRDRNLCDWYANSVSDSDTAGNPEAPRRGEAQADRQAVHEKGLPAGGR